MVLSRFKVFFYKAGFKVRIWQALRSGPPFRSDMDRIIIDLTHFCDLSCPDCNRSCSQAPAAESIRAEQIRRFVSESVEAGKVWKRIWLEGGEPTLNPELDEILDILLQYKKDHSVTCQLLLCTNGYGEKARQMIHNPPDGLRIKNSAKSPAAGDGHFPFNVAPADLPEFSGADFSHACYIHRIFGLGLNRYGYYPHPVCGGIDRVFGFDIGLKHLPTDASEMSGQMRRLCALCGHFREYYSNIDKKSPVLLRKTDRFPEGSRSESWIRAYRNFNKKKPVLTLY